MDYAFPSSQPWQPMTVADLLPTANLMFWFYIAWCFIYLSLEYRTALVDREVDLARAREMALDAQNRMLRYQLNPHFLFNTLNALSALVMDNKRDQAESVLLALSRFLRYSLEQDPASKTELRHEIAAQEEYLAIEQIRFADKLRYVKSLEPDAMTALVPGFILQPAVENAIKYAVSPSTRPVTIEISARVDNDKIVLGVRDDGAATKCAGNGLGVGLDNVRRRLDLIYGARAKMVSRAREEGGFEMELQLPLERK
jgi:LytS/YehU family sensor histidine kinase